MVLVTGGLVVTRGLVVTGLVVTRGLVVTAFLMCSSIMIGGLEFTDGLWGHMEIYRQCRSGMEFYGDKRIGTDMNLYSNDRSINDMRSMT